MKARLLIWIILLGVCSKVTAQSTLPGNMVNVKGGTFVPLYGSDSTPVTVKDFNMDIYPVTNADYMIFVKKYPQWSKSKVKHLFADANYLRFWKADQSLGENESQLLNSPVVNVSWFAAKAYCECQGKRLPTVYEWEYTVRASETKPDASKDNKFYQRSLDWYSQPNPKVMPAVNTGFKNYYGIYGMIGMVWEWTLDYNSTMMAPESRSGGTLDRQLFCGAGSSGSKDVQNYVAFMRNAFRSSLKANYTVSNLGFRCASSK